MDPRDFEAKRRFVETPSGRIGHVEHGSGPAALFVHGVLLNGYLWRHQLAALGSVRRCIALDLLALQAPTLVAWGTDDIYFDVKGSHWLGGTIPGTRRRVDCEGARLFFPEERWQQFNDELRAHWLATA